MSFLKKLFGGGGGGSEGSGSEPVDIIEFEGYSITPTPMKDGAQFRIAGTISREIDGEVKTHKFIRADLFGSATECNDACIRKAKQVINEQGENIFK